jgi:hypothetical protein
MFAVFIAHWVNRVSSTTLGDPVVQSSLKNLLSAFSWALLFFIVLQVSFAIGALLSIGLNRNAAVHLQQEKKAANTAV